VGWPLAGSVSCARRTYVGNTPGTYGQSVTLPASLTGRTLRMSYAVRLVGGRRRLDHARRRGHPSINPYQIKLAFENLMTPTRC